jgi:Zn-dependent metalloprotease
MSIAFSRLSISLALVLAASPANVLAFGPDGQPAGRSLLAAIPEPDPGIELASDHAGVRALVAGVSRSPRTYVSLEPGSGAVATMLGDLAPSRASRPEDAAASFVTGRLGLPLVVRDPAAAAANLQDRATDGLALLRVRTSLASSHVTFAHVVSGLPVRGEEVEVHVASDGRVTALSGSFHPYPADAAAAAAGGGSIDRGAAIAAAAAHLGVRALRAAATSRRVWIPAAGRLVLAHEVRLPAGEPLGDFEVAVDARTGAVIGGEDQLCFATGEGKVYPHSPLDNDLIHVSLGNLNALEALSGKYVKIANGAADDASAADGKYVYDPGDTHFAEVMMYHNLSKVHSYFKTLGFSGRDRPTKATVHYGHDYDNAFYSPMTDSLAFGDGKKLNNLSLEDNVALHEYTHAVNRVITSLGGGEGGAMNEAFADYFAGTINGDSRIGVWAMAKMGKPWMRNMANDKHYPEDIVHEVHRDGEIWGGACWDLRKALGARTADRVLFKSLYFLPSRPTFVKAAEAVLAADRELFSGRNQDKIREVFAARGIRVTGRPRVRALARQALFLDLVGGGAGDCRGRARGDAGRRSCSGRSPPNDPAAVRSAAPPVQCGMKLTRVAQGDCGWLARICRQSERSGSTAPPLR